MNFTSIEQSKALIEAGLNPETSDMFYNRMKSDDEETDWTAHAYQLPKLKALFVEYIPCWSTGALIDVLPKYIKNDDVFYKLKIIQVGLFSHWKILYSARVPFKLEKRTVLTNKTIIESSEKDIFIDALIEMILLCLENGYIEKERKLI